MTIPLLTKPKRRRKRANGRAAKGTAEHHLLTMISEHPGKTGAELVRLLSGVVEGRTVRTALRRSRLKGLIEKHNDDGWFKAA
jgi:hypothetical protein